jgi:hypothetical protein
MLNEMQKFKHFINKPVLFIGFIKKHHMLTEQEDFDELDEKFKKKFGNRMEPGDLHGGYEHINKLNKLPLLASPHDTKNYSMIQNIKHYSGAGSKLLNKHLLSKSKVHIINKGKLTPLKTSKEIRNDDKNTAEKIDKHMSAAIKMHKAEKDFHVYSGMSFTPEYKKGKIKLPAYTSTSLSKNVAQGFAETVNHSSHIYDKDGKKFDFAIFKRHKAMVKNILNRASDHYMKSLDNNEKGDYHSYKSTELYDRYAKVKSNFAKKYNDPVAYSHMIKLHVPKSSHALYLEPHTGFNGEHEVVIHKNAQVHLHDKPEIDHKNKRVIWQGKLIHDGIKPTKYMKEIK